MVAINLKSEGIGMPGREINRCRDTQARKNRWILGTITV